MHILEPCALQVHDESNWNNYIIHLGVILRTQSQYSMDVFCFMVFMYLTDVCGKGWYIL